jgi:hypothetical protein
MITAHRLPVGALMIKPAAARHPHFVTAEADQARGRAGHLRGRQNDGSR